MQDDPAQLAALRQWIEERPGHEVCKAKALAFGEIPCAECREWCGIALWEDRQRLARERMAEEAARKEAEAAARETRERERLQQKAIAQRAAREPAEIQRKVTEMTQKEIEETVAEVEQRLSNGLVSMLPGLPPPQGPVVELPEDDGLRVGLNLDWIDVAWEAFTRLVPGAEFECIEVVPVGERLEVTLTYRGRESRPVPFVRVKVAVAFTAAAGIRPHDESGWGLLARTPSGVPLTLDLPCGTARFLREPVRASKSLGELTLPLAVLEALGRGDLQAPGAAFISESRSKATWVWECDGQKFHIPSVLVELLRGLSLEDGLKILGMHEMDIAAAKAALYGTAPTHSVDSGRSLSEAESSPFKGDVHALREATAAGTELPGGPPSDIREEAIAALRSLPGKGFSVKEARELVAEVCVELPAEASAEEVVRAVLASLDVG